MGPSNLQEFGAEEDKVIFWRINVYPSMHMVSNGKNKYKHRDTIAYTENINK